MNVRYSETNAYYSLDSQRDFEDFCKADIRQTVEGSRPGSDCAIESMTMSRMGGQGQGYISTLDSGMSGFKGLR